MSDSTLSPVPSAAAKLLKNGFSAIPVNGHNHQTMPKAPLTSWKKYQEKQMASNNVPAAFANGCSIALVCGKVSGNLEELDFDNPNLLKPFFDALKEINSDLCGKLDVKIKTPSGGYAIPYRCETAVGGNEKLAIGLEEVDGLGEHKCSWRPKKYQAKQIGDKYYVEVVAIETRGEGGYFLIPPSDGYKKLENSLLNIPTITADERSLLLQLARSFTDKPDIPECSDKTFNKSRPGDEYNQSADIPALIKRDGWTPTGRTGIGGDYWRRPGKKQGTSATLKDGIFYNFSSNAPPFDAQQGYSAFAIYALLEHNGDFSSAAKQLATEGYSQNVKIGDKERGSANIANASQETESWEAPITLETPALPSITRGMMPSTLEDMVFTVSANTETPPELAAILALTVCATACQKKYVVESSPGHTEQLSLWGVAALESGNRKSSVEKRIVAPLRKWEKEAREALEPVIKEATAQRENELSIIKGLRGKLSKSTTDNREKINDEILRLEKDLTEVPQPPQVWEQDITPEHLGTVMDRNNECLGLFSSEGGIFDILGGRYSKGVPNLDLFLQSHSGDSVRVSRGSRPPVNLNEPALSIGISPQPAVLKAMSKAPGFRGRGLIARFMYVLPHSPLGYRKLTNLLPISDEVYKRYSTTIQKLLSEKYPEDEPVIIKMSSEATSLWSDFFLLVEKDLRDGARFEHIKDWAGKLPGLVARIAGVYHCIEPDGKTLSEATMTMALKLADMLIAHALAVFDLMGVDEEMSGARKILSWIKRHRFSEFSRRDCFEATKGTFINVLTIEASLDVLEEYLLIRKRPHKKKRGRPKTMYDVNPKLDFTRPPPIGKTNNGKEGSTTESSSQNSQKEKLDEFCELCEPISESDDKHSLNNSFPEVVVATQVADKGWEEI